MSVEGVVTDTSLYKRAKDFCESIMAGDVMVKHVDDDDRGNSDEIPF
jgi:hypothetical protein